MTNPDPSEALAPEGRPARAVVDRRQRARVILAAVVGALVAVFALLNLNDVKVHWLFATGQTPLIVVVVLAFLFGVLTDRLLLALARRKRRE